MSLQFRPHPDFKARVDVVGRDRAPILVIENLVGDPEAIRQNAMDAFQSRPKHRASFPGLTASAPDEYALQALQFLLPLLREAFVEEGPILNGGCDFQVMTTPAKDLLLRQRIPHFDVPNTSVIASVHFLCQPPYQGTAFYRHKTTGFEIMTADRVTIYERELVGEMSSYPPEGYIGGDTAIFEQIARYDAIYNRAIFFSAASLHSACAAPEQLFSADPSTGRLTSNMFIQFR